jgi:oligo-1,6-glucosidase/alpha-glucosidase
MVGSDTERAWWKEAVVYQIYPRSFADSDGDGIGDLPGVIDHLDHVERLGADVIWLNPVYESPQHDNGYDIADYRAIHDEYGTMADWERLLSAVHDRDMRLVMDLAVNHTSTAHDWFQRSRRGEDGYREYYFWREGETADSDVSDKTGDTSYETRPATRGTGDESHTPPNNWTSGFGGSAWAYDDVAGMQYLHLFDETQADLNWEAEAVRDDVYELMNWWLEKGIDGFRLDVINLVSKPDGLPDGDPDAGWVGIEQFANGPRVEEHLAEMATATYDRPAVDETMVVGECVGVDVETASDYVGADGPMDMVFQFEHVELDSPEGWLGPAEWSLPELKAVFSRWQTELDGWNALYLTNHDQPRIVSRFGDEAYRRESATLFGTLLFTLSGTPYVYQGQALGMTNFPWEGLEQLDDPQTIGKVTEAVAAGEIDGFDDVREIVRARTRDNARTPMQWDDSEAAGFTDGEPWLPVNPNYTEVNAASQTGDDDSVFAYYQRLRELRADHDVLVYGEYDLLLPDHESIWAYRRTLDVTDDEGEVTDDEGEATDDGGGVATDDGGGVAAEPQADSVTDVLVVLNVDDTETEVTLPLGEDAVDDPELLVSNVDTSTTTLPAVTLAPYEARVYAL